MSKKTKFFGKLLAVITVLFFLTPFSASALNITLQWNENIVGDNVTGYVICYESYTTSTPPANDYTTEQDVVLANITGVGTGTVQYIIPDLANGHYWFSVRAYRVEEATALRSGHAAPVTNKGNGALNATLLLLLDDN